jgi:hypothetical protein
MVTVKSCSPPRNRSEDEEVWVSFTQVEHKLEVMTRRATPVTPMVAHQVNQGATWTVVQRQPRHTTPSTWSSQEATSLAPTRWWPNPSRQRPRPRFIPKSERDTPVDAKSAPYTKHTASRTSWLNTRSDSKACQSISLKLTKSNVVRCQSLELAGWYPTVPYLQLKAM